MLKKRYPKHLKYSIFFILICLGLLSLMFLFSSPVKASHISVLTLRPTVCISHPDMMYFNSSSYVDAIDDTISDGNDSYIYLTAPSGANAIYEIEDHTVETGDIYKIQINAVIRGDIRASCLLGIDYPTYAVWIWTENYNSDTWGEANVSYYLNANESTKYPFTWDDIDNLRVRICLNGGIYNWTCTKLWVDVYYITNNEPVVYVDDDFDSSIPDWEEKNFSNIDAAIGVCSDGGTVYINSGTYFQDECQSIYFEGWRCTSFPPAIVHIYNKNINIVGFSNSTTILNGHINGGFFDIRYCDDVSISNLKMENFGANYDSKDVIPIIYGISAYLGVNNLTISNCSMFNATPNNIYGTQISYGMYITADNCTLDNIYCYKSCYSLGATTYDFKLNIGYNLFTKDLTIERSSIPTSYYYSIYLSTRYDNVYGNFTFDNCHINKNRYGIFFSDVGSNQNIIFTLNNSDISNIYYTGLSISKNIGYVYVLNNSFYNCNTIGTETTQDYTTNNLIGCQYLYFENNTINSDKGCSLTVDTFDYAYIFNNIFMNGWRGIFFDDDAYTTYTSEMYDCDVYDNTFSGFSHSGIYLVQSKNCSIYDNIINTSLYGIYNTESVVRQKPVFNNSFNFDTYGVYYTGAKKDSVIQNNSFTGCTTGAIYLLNSNYLSVEDNEIYNNGANIYGIKANNCDHIEINGNYIHNNTDDGIFLVLGDHNTVTYNTIENQLYDNGIHLDNETDDILKYNLFDSVLYGIKAYYLSHSIIANNTFYDNTNEGIWYDNNHVGHENQIYNNTFKYCGALASSGYGLYIKQSISDLVYNNYFANNYDGNIFATDNTFMRWNTTKTLQKNIIGGNYTGGNYFDDYTGVDTDGDGLGNTPYLFLTGTDYLPLTYPTYINVNVYNESNCSQPLVFDILVSSINGTLVYEQDDCYYLGSIPVTALPYDEVIIKVSADGYNFRLYYVTLVAGENMSFNIYLPPKYETGGEMEIVIRSATDSVEITNPAVDVTIDTQHDINEIISVQVYNISLYGQIYNETWYPVYGGWQDISSDYYSYSGDQLTIEQEILDSNMTMARVNYYYEFYQTKQSSYLYQLTVNDWYNLPINNATIVVKRYINCTGIYENMSIIRTDGAGHADVYLIPDELYQFTVSKSGFETEISYWVPTNALFTHIFQLSRIVNGVPSYNSFFYSVLFTASMTGLYMQLGNVTVVYNDLNLSTINTSVYIYSYYNGVYTLVHFYSNTSIDSFVVKNGSINTTRSLKIVLYFNNTAGYIDAISPITIMVPALYIYTNDTGFSKFNLNNRITPLIGPFMINGIAVPWGNVIPFGLGMIVLVLLGPFHVGAALIGSGLIIGFTNGLFSMFLTDTFPAMLITLCPIFIVLGVMYIMSKQGREYL